MSRSRPLIVLTFLLLLLPFQLVQAAEPLQASEGPKNEVSILQSAIDWLKAIIMEIVDAEETCTACEPPPPSPDMNQETCAEALPNLVPGGSPDDESGC